MEIPSLPSVFDATEWFLDNALNDGEYLQPMKMQYLMYLTQAYYAALTHGKRFIPVVFCATSRGPIEPNSYRIYASTRPLIQYQSVDKKSISFMQTIWRRFGSYSADYLSRLIAGHDPYARAFAGGEGSEISLEEMAVYYAGKSENSTISRNADLGGMRVMRTSAGKSVAVKKWLPTKKK